MSSPPQSLQIGWTRVEVSNLDKVLYPETGFTKGDVIRYYVDVAPVLLPHLAGRALTMKRYPDGVGKFFFYEKNCPPHRPNWLEVASVPSSQRGKAATRHCVIDSLRGLVWAANLADLELHVSLARAKARHRPTALVFDLDPGEGAGLADCCRVALQVRDVFAAGKVQCWAKTSGSKGLQVYVPLNRADTDFDRTKEIARQLAEQLAADHPREIVANMRKDLRRGKVLIDWSQNDDHKTTVCVYSLRATPRPSVSTPVTWPEVEAARRSRQRQPLRFGPDEVRQHVAAHGDLFAPVLKLRQKL